MEKKNNTIPYVKPARVGNFKIWRSKFNLSVAPTEEEREKVRKESGGRKKAVRQKVDVECINISSLDGTWSMRIPSTFEMFGMLTAAYYWYHSEADEEKKRGEDFLLGALSNMMYVSCICNGFFHQGVRMLTEAYANPSLLRDTEQNKAFVNEAKMLVERFLAWRDEYDKHVQENEPTEQELHQEEIAEAAMEILNEEKGREDLEL